MMRQAPARPLVFGLLNNMPDAVMQQTETQFRNLLHAVAGHDAIRLDLFALPALPRGEMARRRIADQYRPAAALMEAGLDGLIVTGMEPQAGSLRGEAWWPEFAGIVDWAGVTATPSLFSCLAAHAAVLHRDGIERVRHAEKLFGIYACHPADAGAANLPSTWLNPHSRWHDLRECDLVARRYEISSRIPDVGVDAFVAADAPFLFLQGHPEYDERALLREYARDATRAINGERAARLTLPCNYVDTATEMAMRHLNLRLGCEPAPVLRAELSRIVQAAIPNRHLRTPGGLSPVANWVDAYVARDRYLTYERIAS